ncbi:hypothetical protein E4U57_002419 [Claviceps arundinis]|uniref:Uncharacterized protein n=1 Tax=Claviceps arundinis TaxID=1623583 RepID=A0A9P7N323_9HYPO|nr:hypothetical protein E4U57_002419 [Claviceps arundinis]KAG5978569.1 hypothetical protein E4U56_000004 [Claviceps arundinis]
MASHQPSSASRHREQRPCPTFAASRLSLSRTERYRQFPADSSSCVLKDEFPIFAHTGDVEITVRGALAAAGVETVSNTYLLHQHTLARCSGFFAASTSSQWSKAQSDTASVKGLARDIGDDGNRGGSSSGGDKDGRSSTQNAFGSTGPKRRWKYELDHGTVKRDIPMLVQIDPSRAPKGGPGQAGDSQSSSPSLAGPGSGGPAASHTTSSSLQPEDGPPATLNGSQRAFDARPTVQDIVRVANKVMLRNYDNLFRLFYNDRPMLEDTNVFLAYRQCLWLLDLADQYDALAVARPCVEHHLLQFQSRLWEEVARHSRGFLEFGYMTRSKVIFKEALIHTVGIWHLSQKIPDLDIPDFVLDIAEGKVHELQGNISRVEDQLFRLNLTTEQGQRVTASNDCLGWLVVSLFRQWLTDNTEAQIGPAYNSESESESDDGHVSDEDSAAIQPNFGICQAYRTLGSDSPSAFLDHNDCEEFLALNPQLYTPENLDRFEKRMADLKALARDVVRPLLHNSLELNVDGPNISWEALDKPVYFTCTTVEDEDIPWTLRSYVSI